MARKINGLEQPRPKYHIYYWLITKMKTKIINYDPGSKGDFIVNFLNDKISFELLGQSSASAGSDTRTYGQSLLNSELGKYVDLLLQSDYQEEYISSHSIIYMNNEMLSRLYQKYDLYHIYVEEEWQQHVNIDIMFKVFTKPIHISLVEKSKKLFEKNVFEKLEYVIDFQLLQMSKDITNENRFEFINFYIKNNRFFNTKNTFVKSLNYSKIFTSTFSDLENLLSSSNKKFDKDLYIAALKKSFLPKTIDAFGKTFNIEELGYRYYI
jgi:hypothetical protein